MFDDRKPRDFGAVLQIFHGDGIGQVPILEPELRSIGVLARVENAVHRVGVEISTYAGYEVVPCGANLGTLALGGLAMPELLAFLEILDCYVYQKHNARGKYHVVQIYYHCTPPPFKHSSRSAAFARTSSSFIFHARLFAIPAVRFQSAENRATFLGGKLGLL